MCWAGDAGKQCQSTQSDPMSGLPALLSQELSQVSCLDFCVHAACTGKQCKRDTTGVIIFQLCLSLQLCRMKLASYRPLQPSSSHQLQLYQFFAVNHCILASVAVPAELAIT